MSPFINSAKELFLRQVAETEFDVSAEDFANLEIRLASGFYYFL